MFRRKEENTDASTAPSSAAATSGSSSSSSFEHSDAGQQTTSPNVPSNNTYVPGGASSSSSARSSEPARPAIPPAASSYRPAPIAEFNRGASRSESNPMRSSPASTSSFGTAGEKAVKSGGNRRVLTVGNDILLKGEIATCDRLVIEGRVEAKLSEVHTVEIAEVGSFKGTAEVEDAEVSGVFEGDLIVRNRLVIYASGEVRGNISYGEIEIERGGRLTGQIKTGGPGAKGKNAYEGEKRPSKDTVAA